MKDLPPYWTDTSKKEFLVTIQSVEEQDGYYHISIRENVIRPAGGGQAGEKGKLKVNDKQVVIGDTLGSIDRVVLVTDGVLPVGVKADLEIDQEWRRSMMRNHTAEHVLVSILKREHKDIEVGELWIDGKHGTVELLHTSLDFDTIFKAEKEVSRIIEQDIPIKIDFVESSNLDSSVRSREGLSEKHKQLRIVRIGDFDSSACSGIHVSRTREIGIFKVVDVKTGDGSTHIEFVTGLEATTLVTNLYNVALSRKYSYPFEMEQLGSVLDKAKEAISEKQCLVEKITELLAMGPNEKQLGRVYFRHEYLPGFDAHSLRILANQLSSGVPSVILLFAPGLKSQIILRVFNLEMQASDFISDPLTRLGGRGGGKGEVFTGGFVDVEDPMKLYNDLVTEIQRLIKAN